MSAASTHGLVAALLVGGLLAACGSSGGGSSGTGGPSGADFSAFRVARITVDTTAFEVWMAETPAQRQQGLMEATPQQLAPLPDGTPRGMLFVYATDTILSFWMQDTHVPLDLAYLRADGMVVEVHALQPLDVTRVTSSEEVRYALEVSAGDFAAHGIGVGSILSLPLP